MVEDRLSDGPRIAQLLASELDGRGGELAGVDVVEARPDVEPTPGGAFAYAAVEGSAGAARRLAEVYVHPERVRLELHAGRGAAAAAAEAEGLDVESTDSRTAVWVDDGAAVKRAVPAVVAARARE